MTSWYVQNSGGSDNNGGTSWAVRSTDTDGVTNGTNTLTSVAAKFVAGDVGHGIFIGGVNQWRLITVFTSSTSINFSGATIASASGRTWTIGGRFATVGKATSIAGIAAGDTIYVAPGTYKETLTLGSSGGNTYSTGTVSVTNGSATVTGSSTAWLANAFATNGFFKQSILASGTDGVTDGTTAFTSAAGNFQAGMVGKFIQINTKAAYQITAVGSATAITLSGSPSAGTGLTYSVMTGEPPYQISTVDSDTQITLTRAWDGPTATGLAYLTYQAINYVGDYLGTNTDGVGGLVRISGAAANEQTASRSNCIVAATKSYMKFSGFLLDCPSSQAIQLNTGCTHVWFDKCFISNLSGTASTVQFQDASMSNLTVSNCVILLSQSNGINLTHSSAINDSAIVIQSCIVLTSGVGPGLNSIRIGGVTVSNCLFWGLRQGVNIQTAITAGQCLAVFNSTFCGCNTALLATATSEIMEDYNRFSSNATNRSNVGTGAHSLSYLYNPDSRWFFQMAYLGAGPNSATQVISPFDLASFDAIIDSAGLYPPAKDIRGTGAINSVREKGPLEYDSTLKTQGGGGGINVLVAGGMVVT
jgi:hypothetical protein